VVHRAHAARADGGRTGKHRRRKRNPGAGDIHHVHERWRLERNAERAVVRTVGVVVEPLPPRIAVRPSPPTSHAKPTRGATFFSDGLANGPPSTLSGDVRTSGRYASRPSLSRGT